MFIFQYDNANIPVSAADQARCADIMQGITGEMRRRMQRWFWTAATAGFLTLSTVFTATVFAGSNKTEFPTDSAPVVAIARWG